MQHNSVYISLLSKVTSIYNYQDIEKLLNNRHRKNTNNHASYPELLHISKWVYMCVSTNIDEHR